MTLLRLKTTAQFLILIRGNLPLCDQRSPNESKEFTYRFVCSFVKLSSQEKGAHIIVGTFPHSRAREVFCEVMHFISVICLTPQSKFRLLKELVKFINSS